MKSALLAAPAAVCALVFISCLPVLQGGVFGIQVSGVDVTPDTLEAVVARGADTVFFAEVEGTDNRETDWQILESGSPDTRITPAKTPARPG